MRPLRDPRKLLCLLLVAAVPTTLVGCGDDVPATGTTAAPVNPDQAAQQNKAMQDFLQSKMKTKTSPKK